MTQIAINENYLKRKYTHIFSYLTWQFLDPHGPTDCSITSQSITLNNNTHGNSSWSLRWARTRTFQHNNCPQLEVWVLGTCGSAHGDVPSGRYSTNARASFRAAMCPVWYSGSCRVASQERATSWREVGAWLNILPLVLSCRSITVIRNAGKTPLCVSLWTCHLLNGARLPR